jgi:hypothetical protein
LVEEAGRDAQRPNLIASRPRNADFVALQSISSAPRREHETPMI